MLLNAGADINSPHGWPIQAAASQGHLDVVQLLIERGAAVNAFQANEYFTQGTALQAACEAGWTQIAALLLEHGADPNLGAGEETCPIIAAAWRGEDEILAHLIRTGARVDVFGGPDNSSPLIYAAMTLPQSSLQALLDAGADINLADSDGDTALILAANRGEKEVVQFLVDRGADPLHTNNRNANAMQVAFINEHMECVRILVWRVSATTKALKREADAGNEHLKLALKTAAVETVVEPEVDPDSEDGGSDDNDDENDDEGDSDGENDQDEGTEKDPASAAPNKNDSDSPIVSGPPPEESWSNAANSEQKPEKTYLPPYGAQGLPSPPEDDPYPAALSYQALPLRHPEDQLPEVVSQVSPAYVSETAPYPPQAQPYSQAESALPTPPLSQAGTASPYSIPRRPVVNQYPYGPTGDPAYSGGPPAPPAPAASPYAANGFAQSQGQVQGQSPPALYSGEGYGSPGPFQNAQNGPAGPVYGGPQAWQLPQQPSQQPGEAYYGQQPPQQPPQQPGEPYYGQPPYGRASYPGQWSGP